MILDPPCLSTTDLPPAMLAAWRLVLSDTSFHQPIETISRNGIFNLAIWTSRNESFLASSDFSIVCCSSLSLWITYDEDFMSITAEHFVQLPDVWIVKLRNNLNTQLSVPLEIHCHSMKFLKLTSPEVRNFWINTQFNWKLKLNNENLPQCQIYIMQSAISKNIYLINLSKTEGKAFVLLFSKVQIIFKTYFFYIRHFNIFNKI